VPFLRALRFAFFLLATLTRAPSRAPGRCWPSRRTLRIQPQLSGHLDVVIGEMEATARLESAPSSGHSA
jgi:hypothetical protein